MLAVAAALAMSAGAAGSSGRVRLPDLRIPGVTGAVDEIRADRSGIAIETGGRCTLLLAEGPPYRRAVRKQFCTSGGEPEVIEELAYTGGRAVWTICMETNSMNCSLETSTVSGERGVELATYCCDYAFTGFAPIAGGGLIVYRAQASGRLMQVTPSGRAVPLTMPRLLLGARPLATDGTRIAFFARKTVYVVDRRGHAMAHWPQETPGADAAFAQDRLVVAPSWSTAALLVHDLRTGKSSRVTLTPTTHWGHHFVGASGNLVAYLAGKLAKDQYGNVVWTATRVQLVRVPDGRTVTVANIKDGSSTFGPYGLLVASGAPPDIQLIGWAKLQTLLQRR